jgi:hypothetical protein
VARRVTAILALVTAASLAAPAVANAAPGATTGGQPAATTEHLFAGGTFSQAGGRATTNIARWSGVDWAALSGPAGEGANDQVNAMVVYNGKLIVGGSFTMAGKVTVNGVAAWDGRRWSALVGSSGVPGVIHFPFDFVHSLAVYNGSLYLGGQFVVAGGTLQVNNVVRWNGSNWSALSDASGNGVTSAGSPSGASVFDLTVYNNQLVAGGGFDAAGGITTNDVASWNGTTWSALGLPAPQRNLVLALGLYNGQLVAANGYSQDNLPVNEVDVFNGTSWAALTGPSGGSFDSDIRDLTVYNNNLIAGGQFANSPGGAADGIAQWNGTSWSALPGTTSGNAEIFSLTVSNGLLVAGGSFSSLGGVTATNIADWNGTAWSALAGPAGQGTNGTVYSTFSTTLF